MSLALQEAWKYQLLTYSNPAVGAVVLASCGKILSIAAHKKAGAPHAEVEALKEAYIQLTQNEEITSLTDAASIHEYLLENHNGVFMGCSIYVTLEPCTHKGKTPSCAMLLSALKIKEVYIGTQDPNQNASGGVAMLQRAGVQCEVGILQKQCDALLLPFQNYLEGNFVFFKWAQRLDGTTQDGVISSQASRELVHKMRDVCDLLVIGGNTVRVDRPRLDARLVNGKAPDVLIFSRQKEFDSSIPLFNVPERKVFIEDSLERIKEYGCVMIEGSSALFEATKGKVDCYLAFIAPKFAKSEGFKGVEAEFCVLSERKVGDDIMAWMILR